MITVKALKNGSYEDRETVARTGIIRLYHYVHSIFTISSHIVSILVANVYVNNAGLD